MTHEQAALWQKIRDFQIDAPNASYSYTTRLARENGWTPVYAERVVSEYRRFAFLAIASGHGATPSKAVDEAWHLHLLYTRNYWEEFCPQALGRPLHHNPADGGEADEAKYRDWYAETLASYRRLFGEEPPKDVWPTKSTPPRKRPWAWLAIFSLGLVGCGEPANPLDWTGPSFLQLFAGLYVAALTVAGVLRWRLRGSGDGPPAADWRLHVYEEAYLNEGPELALAADLARLQASGRVQVEKKRFRTQPGAQGDHPLDRAILRAADSPTGASYETLRRVAEPTLDEMEASLRRQGLWVGDPGAQWLPAIVACLPVLLAGRSFWSG